MKEIEGIKFFTTLEIALKLKVTPQTIREYIKKEKLKGQRLGRSFYISEKSLKEFLNIL